MTRPILAIGRGCAKLLFYRHKIIGGKMYTGKHAYLRPLQPAFIMANSGEAVSYAELEARSNRLAHLFRNWGLKPAARANGRACTIPASIPT
jgi:acyl-CoA synthetase (AMP-forming)/AMP-acid ligase II